MTTPTIYYVIALVGISIESLVLAAFVWWRSRGHRGILPFSLMMGGLTIWTVSYIGEILAPDVPTKLLATQFEYLGIATIPVTLFVFCAAYTNADWWLSRRNLILVSIMPVLTILMVSTNNLHHIFYTQIELATSGPVPELDVTHGPWFWVHAAYSYGMVLAGIVMLIRALGRSSELYRRQIVTVLAGMVAPWIGNAIYIFGLSPIPNLDITPFFFAFTGVMMAISLLRFRLLDIVPAARDMVVESMSEALMVFDMERRMVDLNPAARAMLGPAAEGAIGQQLTDILPEQRDLILRFREMEEAQAEIVVPVVGVPRTLEMRLSTLRNRRGTPTGRLLVLRDISAAKLAEKKLAEARDQALEALRMRTRILAVVSHELRTPLGAILGYADMLRAGAQGPITESQMTVVNRMISNATHLTDLVNDLLDEAQIEQGKITLHIAPIEPARLMESVEVAMGQRARDQGLRLVTRVAPDAPAIIRTDLSRMTQIVNNLVGNALKFTRQGDVTVSLLKVDEDHWGISVSDSGPGIAQENQRLIFEPFWQVDNPETREHKGVGLGLSIARQMTQLLGGEIRLDSAPGRGTTFIVLFPWIAGKEKASSDEKISGLSG